MGMHAAYSVPAYCLTNSAFRQSYSERIELAAKLVLA